MPFDSAGFQPQPPPPRKVPASGRGNAGAAIVIVSAAALLLTPISAAALVDIVHYVRYVGSVRHIGDGPAARDWRHDAARGWPATAAAR